MECQCRRTWPFASYSTAVLHLKIVQLVELRNSCLHVSQLRSSHTSCGYVICHGYKLAALPVDSTDCAENHNPVQIMEGILKLRVTSQMCAVFHANMDKVAQTKELKSVLKTVQKMIHPSNEWVHPGFSVLLCGIIRKWDLAVILYYCNILVEKDISGVQHIEVMRSCSWCQVSKHDIRLLKFKPPWLGDEKVELINLLKKILLWVQLAYEKQ